MTITLPSPTALARTQEGIDLSGEDFPSAYDEAIASANLAICDLQRYIVEVTELANHRHEWASESGFCMVCGADGNA